MQATRRKFLRASVLILALCVTIFYASSSYAFADRHADFEHGRIAYISSFAGNSFHLNYTTTGLSLQLPEEKQLDVMFVDSLGVSPVGTPFREPLPVVTYDQLWSGISATYETTTSTIIKSTFDLAPFADVAQIQLRYNVPIHIDSEGNLLFDFGTGYLQESAPIAWQTIDGQRIPVDVAFQPVNKHQVSYKVGDYNPTHPLTIDPGLTWHTFLGSQSEDVGSNITVDSEGNAYVVGYSVNTWGTNPVRPYAGTVDGFVAKISPAGVLLWHTFLGSGANDVTTAIYVEDDGDVYVVGNSFGAWQGSSPPVRSFVGGVDTRDVFVAKLNGDGELLWNTFLGGSGEDHTEAVAVDSAGRIYVAGYSAASWGSPVNGFAAGGRNAFLARLNNNGGLNWHTFMGEPGFTTLGFGVAVDDAAQRVYVAGESEGSWGSNIINNHTMSADAFVAKFSSSNGQQIWSTFWGSNGIDGAGEVQLDATGDVYIVGTSIGSWSATPVSPYQGQLDAFAAKLNKDSGALEWHTFLGTQFGNDKAFGLAIDADQNLYLAGETFGPWGASTIRPYRDSRDGFVAKLDGRGNLVWNTFLGAVSDPLNNFYASDFSNAIALDQDNNLYVSGFSGWYWITPSVQAYQGGGDIVVTKLPSTPFVVNRSLTNNGAFVATEAPMQFELNRAASPSLADSTGILVRGRQSGIYEGSLSGDSTISFNSDAPFRAGERLLITASSNLLAGNDAGTLVPYSQQLWVATAPSTAQFASSTDVGSNASTDIALGDLDGDGDLDAFITNDDGKPNELLLYDETTNTFQRSSQQLGDRNSMAVALGDVDNDGDLDAAVANTGEASQIWINENGQFSTGASLVLNFAARDIKFADFDGDGDLDIFLVYDGLANIVLINNGSGAYSFVDSGSRYLLGVSNSQGAAVGDLDNDGDLDIFVANYQQGNSVWLNDGTGAFFDSFQRLGDNSSRAVDLGDLDNDGDLDAFVANSSGLGEPNVIWENNGFGLFSEAGTVGQANSSDVRLGDVDGDGDLDALVGNLEGNALWLNYGNFTFTRSSQFLGNTASSGIGLGDIDGDRTLDIFSSSFLATQSHEIWFNGVAGANPLNTTLHLPLLTRADPVPMTTLLVTAINTGGVSSVVITDADSGTTLLSCGPLPDNSTSTCGQFHSTQRYVMRATTNNCGEGTGTFNDGLAVRIQRSVQCDN